MPKTPKDKAKPTLKRHPVFLAAEAVDWFAPVTLSRIAQIIDDLYEPEDYAPVFNADGDITTSAPARALLTAYVMHDRETSAPVTEADLAAVIDTRYDEDFYDRNDSANGDLISTAPAQHIWDTYIITPRLPARYVAGTPEADRLTLAAMIPTPHAAERVYEWPTDEAEFWRSSKDDNMVRAAKLSLIRRLKAADRMIDAGFTRMPLD